MSSCETVGTFPEWKLLCMQIAAEMHWQTEDFLENTRGMYIVSPLTDDATDEMRRFRARFWCAPDWRNPDKLRFSSSYPTSKDAWQDPRLNLGISCSMSRGPEAIAKDIGRRLVPELLKNNREQCKRIREAESWVAQRNANMDSFIERTGFSECGTPDRHSQRRAWDSNVGDAKATGNDGIVLELRVLSVDIAVMVVDLVRALKHHDSVAQGDD